MKQRGRKSADVASIVVDVGRPLPPPVPSELTDAQAAVWRDVVGSLPGRWISRAAFSILIAHCRHVCRARLLEMQISKFDEEWVAVEGGLQRLDRLLAAAERETRAVIATARALRLTPQAQMHPRSAGRAIDAAPTGKLPWDREGR